MLMVIKIDYSKYIIPNTPDSKPMTKFELIDALVLDFCMSSSQVSELIKKADEKFLNVQ